jgi:serine/threonine-protein kinase RsbW/stage II sporulation protein AB (anti-sigma F factor)
MSMSSTSAAPDIAARTWDFPALAQRVPAARHVVAGYANEHAIPDRQVKAVELAVTEAVTNAVLHGFRSRDPGTVTVAMTIDAARTISVSVADDGEGMRPGSDGPGLGLGMALMSVVADRVEYRTPVTGRGTEVRMRFGRQR